MKKVVLITGSSTGFGRRTAEQLARAGYTVFASMRHTSGANAQHRAALETLAQAEKLDIQVIEMDVTDDDSVNRGIEIVITKAGHLDILVNNAGIWGPGVLEAFTMEQWQQVFEANVFGSVRVARAALPFLRPQKKGLIIQISSLQGRFILPYSGPYVASKFAIEGAMETFHYELAPFGVDVCIVEPYDFMTEMKMKAVHYLAADESRTDAYGQVKDFIQNAYLIPDLTRAGDPTLVVNAIQHLIETPAGQRPLRTTVSNPLPQIEQINQLANEMHTGLYPYIGLSHLLQLNINPNDLIAP